MHNRPEKTGTNSAYRRVQQQRQENRRMSVVGFVAAIVVLTVVIFGGSSDDDVPVLAPEAGDVGLVPESSVHPLLQYARGVPPIEELDKQIESSSGN
jgi:hypothetical protein